MQTKKQDEIMQIEKVYQAIDSLNVFINHEGGQVIFKKMDFDKRILYVQLAGNCTTCHFKNSETCQKIADFLKKSIVIIHEVIFIPVNQFDLGIVSSLHRKRNI